MAVYQGQAGIGRPVANRLGNKAAKWLTQGFGAARLGRLRFFISRQRGNRPKDVGSYR